MGDLYDEPKPKSAFVPRAGRSPEQRAAGKRRGKLGRLPAPIVVEEARPDLIHDWAEITRYPYVDVEGTLVQEVVRLECSCDGSRHKLFKQVFLNQTGSKVNRKPSGFSPVLFRAPEVAAVRATGEMIWLLEGEKDVETAEALGLVATTNTQGGTSFPDQLLDELAGAVVNLVLDRDDAGFARGVDLHKKLRSVDATVTLLLPKVVEAKADFTDHIEAGFSVDDFIEISCAEAATWAELKKVRAKAHAASKGVAEVLAHLELRSKVASTSEHAQHAKRWAAEVEVRCESLRELVQRVHVAGQQAGTEFAGEAMITADGLLMSINEDARAALNSAGVPVPPGLRATATADAPALGAAPDNEGGETQPAEVPRLGSSGVGATSPQFRIAGGQIVQWEPKRRRDGEEDESEGKFKVILSTVVQVIAREYAETDQDEEIAEVELQGRESDAATKRAKAPKRLCAVRLSYEDPDSGEMMEMRVSADAWRDHSWLESLPGPADYDHKRAGLDTLQRAVVAVSSNCFDTIIHQSTGWRRNADGQWAFIHRRGSITSAGHVPGETAFDSGVNRFDLPDPTTDAQHLREAWLGATAAMLDRLPPRAVAPLLGAAFRSALGHNPWVMTLVGPPGSYKTSIAAKIMHVWGERWSHSKSASSMSGNGDTTNTLRYKLHHAKDTLMWLDDFAPTKSWVEAQKLLEEITRIVHNQEARGRLSRDGLGISDGTPPRASALCTSEVMPRPGSAAERMLIVPVSAHEVDTNLLFPLDEAESRYGRALVGSSFLQWLAGDLPTLRKHYGEVESAFADELASHHQESIRQAAALASTWAGWVAVSDFLLDRGAIDSKERTELLERIRGALVEAGGAATDPDLPRKTGTRIRDLLSYALTQGIAYVDDIRTGECPDWPLAGRLGWRRTVLDEGGIKVRFERGGHRLGYVMTDPGPKDRGRLLVCEPNQLEAVIKAASSTQTEQLQIDRGTAMRALHDEGILLGAIEGGKQRYTLKTRIHVEGRNDRRVNLDLDKLIGEADGDDDPITDPDPDLAPVGMDGSNLSEPCGTVDPQPVAPSAHDFLPLTKATDNTTEIADEEGPDEMPPEPIDVIAADGVVGWTEPLRDDPGPCLMCDQHTSLWIAGGRVHVRCWMVSTSATRRAASSPDRGQTARTVVPEPVTVAAATVPTPIAMTTTEKVENCQAPVSFRTTAAVLDVDGLWLSNGEHIELPEHINHLGDLFELSRELQLGFRSSKYRTESGQIWITNAMAEKFGVEVGTITHARENSTAGKSGEAIQKATTKLPLVTDAIEAGYQLGGGLKAMRAWTRVWKGSAKSVWIVLMAAQSTDPRIMPLSADQPSSAALAKRIGLLADAMGYPFYMGSATTGTDLMKHLRAKDRDRFFTLREPVPPATMNLEPDLDWSRKPTQEEAAHTFVHCYDRSGSFLAGVAGLELGYGEAVHHPEGTKFVPRNPGYWKITIPESGSWLAPHPLSPRGNMAGQSRWVTTPGLEFAIEQDYDPQILEAYTWPEHARILDPWYERLRDARTALDINDTDAQIARAQLKGIYAAAVGMVGSRTWRAGTDGYMPDWRHHIVAKARTNVLRRINQIGQSTGRWPVAVITDSVIYTSNEEDPTDAWPGKPDQLGKALGKYKHEGTGLLAEQLPILGERTYRGRELIVTDEDPGSE